MNKKRFCDSCEFEGELIERSDGMWFHNRPRCFLSLPFRKKQKEGFCYFCGLKEDYDEERPRSFVERSDGKIFHADCAERSKVFK